MIVDTCPKCKGIGTRARTKEEDGAEADPDLHPVLAREPKTCERCGGSRRAILTPDEIKARNAQS